MPFIWTNGQKRISKGYCISIWIKSTIRTTYKSCIYKANFQHKNNVVYHSICPSQGCHENYIGETNRRIVERIQDQNNIDKNSHLLKHAREKGHTHVWENNFKILGHNYQLNIERKISESLYIRQLKPTLNAHEKSIPLHLFNWCFHSNYPVRCFK